MNKTLDIVAVGQASSQLCCAPGLVKQAAADLGIVAPMTINGIPHFASDDLNAIGERVRELQAKTRKART